MANISINTTELRSLLDITPADQNIMLVGSHGIGKSEILTEYFSAKGMTVVPLFLGQMSDPGDLIGIPNRNESTGKTDFMPPYWFPLDGKPIVLFLDELNRARPEVLQTIMDLALNRKLAGRSLPEGSRTRATSTSSPTSTRRWCRVSTWFPSARRSRSGSCGRRSLESTPA